MNLKIFSNGAFGPNITNFEGERALKKTQFFGQNFAKSA